MVSTASAGCSTPKGRLTRVGRSGRQLVEQALYQLTLGAVRVPALLPEPLLQLIPATPPPPDSA
eukprot:COSAG01_NODE_53791_length_336_cov_1.527426_1_plen_63_part_10